MDAVTKIFHEDMMRSAFSEAVADDDYDFIDCLTTRDDDYSSEAEEVF